jgi:hypothetical protein
MQKAHSFYLFPTERAVLSSMLPIGGRTRTTSYLAKKIKHLYIKFAERARFELAVPLPVRQFSKLVV